MDHTRVTVTFDFEGQFGMPGPAEYDIVATTSRLLDLLDDARVTAVFFIVGQIAERHPDVVAELHRRGHTIGLHGYRHERLADLTPNRLAAFCGDLERAVDEIQVLTGRRPRGFRAPYLAGPRFYVPDLYAALAALGFSWISNCEIRFPDELWRAGRLARGRGVLEFTPMRQALTVLLNTGTIVTARGPRSRRSLATIDWLAHGQPPFMRPEGLVEYPLTSPLDCDLLGLPAPGTPSSQRSLAFAADTLCALFDRAGAHFNINCHDWIIGSANRPDVLRRVLAHIADTGQATF